MAVNASENNKIPSGILLTLNTTSDVHLSRCIVCQNIKPKVPLTTGELGRKRLRETADVREDAVDKRLKSLESDDGYMYRNDNECYTSYTLEKTVNQIQLKKHNQVTKCIEDDDTDETDTRTPSRRRSSTTPRQSPSLAAHHRKLKCIVCGNITLQVKGEKVRDKYRMCEKERTEQFFLKQPTISMTVFSREYPI